MNETNNRGQPVYYDRLKELHDFYKSRYEKARSQNIDESSRFYKAFIEIEHRYVALALALEFFDMADEFVLKENVKEYVYGFLSLMMKEMFFGNVIINEHGKKEYLWHRVTIKKSDLESHEAYEKNKEAAKRLREIDLQREDKDALSMELKEIIYHIVSWNMIAREIYMPVNKKSGKTAGVNCS